MQALVTGAAKRLGRAIALELHRAGARVAVHYRESKKEAEETAALLGGAPLIQGDQAREPERIVREASRALGGLDLLVCSAARFEQAPSDQLPRAQFEAMLDSNLTGPFYLMQAALPMLRASRGSIVTLLDLCGTTQVWKGYAHYAASKAGLAGLPRLVALAGGAGGGCERGAWGGGRRCAETGWLRGPCSSRRGWTPRGSRIASRSGASDPRKTWRVPYC